MNEKIAICYTTFKREPLAFMTLASINLHWQENFHLLIGDQGDEREGLPFYAHYLFGEKKHSYVPLKYDIGLSAARNCLVSNAATLGIRYCLIMADSISFTKETVEKLEAAVTFLENNIEYGILGFDLKDRPGPGWEFNMDLKAGEAFVLRPIKKLGVHDDESGLVIRDCEICRNFFLAKTSTLLDVQWDPDLKLSEHEDFFWRYKQAGYKVAWTPEISGMYTESRPADYWELRKRCYGEFQEALKRKYGLSGWVEYAPAEERGVEV